jgi:hypothetical protein
MRQVFFCAFALFNQIKKQTACKKIKDWNTIGVE